MIKLIKLTCRLLDKACCLTHWSQNITCKLGLGYCHLAKLAFRLAEKYDLDDWE